jgi:hypothetical protein
MWPLERRRSAEITAAVAIKLRPYMIEAVLPATPVHPRDPGW